MSQHVGLVGWVVKANSSRIKFNPLNYGQVKSITVFTGINQVHFNASSKRCVCAWTQRRVVKFSLSFILLTNNVSVDRKWDTKPEKWYEIIEFFISSNLQSRAGRTSSLSLTEGGLLQEEHTENTKTSAPVRLQCFHISLSEAEDRLAARGSLRFPVSSGGLRGLMHWG